MAYKKSSHCKYCNLLFTENINHGNHCRWCKLNPKVIELSKPKQLTCIRCGIDFLGTRESRRITCSEKCAKTFSEDAKEKLSKARSLYLKKNPEKHPWKKNTKKSVPCERFKSFLIKNNYQFIEEFSPLKDRHFSIDIYFPQMKLGIEINGNQHYDRSGLLNEYYQQRHEAIEKSGIKLIEVHYSKCFNDETIKSIMTFDYIPDSKNEIELIKKSLEKQLEIKQRNKPLKPGQKAKNAADIKYSEIKNTIFNYGIDFSKFGWTTKVGKIINISNPGKWMKRHHPEFYKQYCFKRPSPK